jgi:hypothetical protein
MASPVRGCDYRRMPLENAVGLDELDRTLDGALEVWPAVADAIVRSGLWCVIEVCDDTAVSGWEPRLIICRTELDDIAEAVAMCIADVPSQSKRIAGYTRDRLVRVDAAPTALCHIAEPLAARA